VKNSSGIAFFTLELLFFMLELLISRWKKSPDKLDLGMPVMVTPPEVPDFENGTSRLEGNYKAVYLPLHI
jgi:hypothetical protein